MVVHFEMTQQLRPGGSKKDIGDKKCLTLYCRLPYSKHNIFRKEPTTVRQIVLVDSYNNDVMTGNNPRSFIFIYEKVGTTE